MPYRYTREITETERETEVLAMLARGNHKSAQDEPEIVGKLLSKDVVHGFSMVIPIELVPLIPNAMVQPVGLAKQWTLDEEGNRVVKYRITQDLSYSEAKDVSINSRIDMEQYPEMVYGWALPRIIHFIVALRLAWPLRTIFIAKYDYSDAYRRMAHSALAVAQTITTCLAYAYVYFRMTFGGSSNPPTWCNFSEMVADLANECALFDAPRFGACFFDATPTSSMFLSLVSMRPCLASIVLASTVLALTELASMLLRCPFDARFSDASTPRFDASMPRLSILTSILIIKAR
jgi:hypothetical protein